MKRASQIWIKSLIRAAITGAANGVGTGLAAIGIKPDVFNLDRGLVDTLTIAGVGALLGAVLAVANYLQRSPLPEE